jgi:dephospho-CoA kinase
MFILGLTGSIGMGKSETARMFRRLGVPVYDADAEVAKAYAPGGAALQPISVAFPGVVDSRGVDRAALTQCLNADAAAWARLEAIVHPLTAKAERAFLEARAATGTPLVVLDIPLLYETDGEDRMDAVLVVTAAPEIQRARALARPAMTAARFDQILARQMPDVEKCARADFIIETDRGFDYAFEAVRRSVAAVSVRKGQAWRRRLSEAA